MNRPRLVIFVRFPEPGRTKTRLIPALGAAGAARLQDAMTRHTLREAARVADVADVEIRFTGGDAAGEAVAHRYGRRSARYEPQGDGSLGERLIRATAAQGNGASGVPPVVVMGSDCPGLSADLLRAAFDGLGGHDVVLGPAADGGYYLIALRRPARLFTGIAWGTNRVLEQTRAAAARAGLSVAMLPTLSDVDVPGDLAACRHLLDGAGMPPPYAPQRVAVTGATGCLGRHFVARLLATVPGVRITALVRDTSPPGRAAAFRRLLHGHPGQVKVVEGDLSDGDRTLARLSMRDKRALAEADGGLWHFAASTNLGAVTSAAAQRAWRVNVGGTAAVLRLLAGSDGPGPLYHLSTAYVCGRRNDVVGEHELDLSATYRNTYEASKAQGERLVREALDQAGGLAGAVFRPSLVIGEPSPGAGPVDCGGGVGLVDVLAATFRRAAAASPVLLPIAAGVAVNAVPLSWATTAMLALAPLAAERRTYHLTSPSDATIEAAAEAAARVFGPLSFERDVAVAASSSSGLVQRLLRPYHPYFEARPRFDRRNVELDAAEIIDGATLDLHAVFAARAGNPAG